MLEYGIDPDDYLHYIHDVSHPELKYDKQLKSFLRNLSGKKFIYTNASQDHAENILSSTSIELFFPSKCNFSIFIIFSFYLVFFLPLLQF